MTTMLLFNTICIEIDSECNRKCDWCPVAYNTRPDERMAPELLRKVLTELGEMNYAKRVELYIYNEPTRDMEYLLEAIAMTRQLVPRSMIMIATNGDYLHKNTATKLERLYAAGLNQLLINCYVKNLYEKRMAAWSGIFEELGLEWAANIYSPYVSRKKRFVQMLDKHDPSTFGTGIFRLINRAGNIPQFLPTTAEPLQRMCVKPFRILNINWKGQALLCCQDYHGELDFGNVRTHTIQQLWNSPVMNTYRRHLLKKDRSLPLCRRCDCHSGAYPGNVQEPTGPFAAVRTIEDKHYTEHQS